MVAFAQTKSSEKDAQCQGFIQTEVGQIPSDWTVASAGDVGKFRGGNGFPLRFQGKQAGLYPFLKVSDMSLKGNERSLRAANNYIDEADRQKLGAYIFPENSIVIAKVGAAVFLERKKLLAQPSCLDNNMAGYWITSPKAHHSFIHHYFQSIRLGDLVSTTALPSLNGTVLASIKLPLPPTTAEQEAIADALSDADALIESLEALIAKKRAIKQGAMQDLLSGRKRLPGFSGEWRTMEIGDFTDCTAGGTPSTLRPDYWGGNIPWMSSGELHQKQVYEVQGRITELGLQESAAKMLPSNCVLVGLAGQGKTRGTVAINRIPLCTNQSIGAILPNDICSSDFLFHNLDARYEELRELSAGDGGRGGLNLNLIRKISISLPNSDEQEAICTALADLDGELRCLDARLEKARQVKQGMMQELLTGRVRLV